jgi:sortilin (neurotensin receptor 3)
MVESRQVRVRAGDVLVLVGTMKGAFVFRSNGRRARWERGGPYFAGQPVYAMAYDDRAGRRRLWAAPSSMHWGPLLKWSDDFGRSWNGEGGPRFPAETGATLTRVWQIRPGTADQPDVLYCGAEPASLFVSNDAGASWTLCQGLYDHPHRPKWQPGGGGLCLHTILPHPTRKETLHVAISTAGVYRTDDAGQTWRTAHKGVRAQFLPDQHPEFGQCVHKVVRDSAEPDRLFLQNHWGLYRTDDGGESWKDIANGVPSDFGFAMEAHPHEPDTVYIVPLESDEFRCTPDGRLRVYRTRNGGRSWQPLTRGLPQEGAFETVLRDAMAADACDKAGLYFGTRSGKLFASRDGGTSWRAVAEGLPPILSVKTAVVGEAARARRPAARKRATSGRSTRSRGAARA